MVGISTEAPSRRPHEVIEDVWFGDEDGPDSLGPYTFTAGEVPDLLSAFLYADENAQIEATVRAKFRWLEQGFSEVVDEVEGDGDELEHLTAWQEIQAAIADPDHWMRTRHLFGMYNALMEAVTNRPPTSPSGSSHTPPRRAGAAKPKRKAATSGS